ncbi:hypothetical protein, partial [Acinetobacter bereziniae]|uniref:hypothetical protein n=1 Tax=Acinetobacter bereziniae TaxID=106648 RepID=UPI003AF6555E
MGTPVFITFPYGNEYAYINIDVEYQPCIDVWQMVAENLEAGNRSSRLIDYLYSYDGVKWEMGKQRIIT